MNSFQLFLNQVQSAPEGLKLKVLQVVFDVVMVHESELLNRSEDIVSEDVIDKFCKNHPKRLLQAERILAFLLQTFEVEESKAVQALLCIGISKLMLNGLVTDERVCFHIHFRGCTILTVYRY